MSATTPTMWGIDLVVVEKADPDQPVAVVPLAYEGDTFEAAAARLRLVRPQVPLPPTRVVAGVRPHTYHLMHLFGPGAPYANKGFEVLAGPAVFIQAAYARLNALARSAQPAS